MCKLIIVAGLIVNEAKNLKEERKAEPPKPVKGKVGVGVDDILWK